MGKVVQGAGMRTFFLPELFLASFIKVTIIMAELLTQLPFKLNFNENVQRDYNGKLSIYEIQQN